MSERESLAPATEQQLSATRALLRRVHELELSALTINYLENDGIVYIGDLIQKTEEDMLRIPNFGRNTLGEIKEVLAQMGLRLGTEVPRWPPANIERPSRAFTARA
jgi:DNA-directed RNA polymerase subunit alpha